jgi:hypothetical protein
MYKNIDAIYLVNGREARFIGAREKRPIYNENGEFLGEIYTKWDIKYLDDNTCEYDLK